jgi:hypothetical protein
VTSKNIFFITGICYTQEQNAVFNLEIDSSGAFDFFAVQMCFQLYLSISENI